MKTKEREFSVWPLMIDMLTSILIIFVLINFISSLANIQEFEHLIIDIKRKAFIEKFDQIFVDEINNNKIEKQSKYNHLKITFSDKILFNSGDYRLGTDGKNVLKKLSSLLVDKTIQQGIDKIQVEGHTDSRRLSGKIEYPKNNWELSAARAIDVIQFLSESKELDIKTPSNLFTLNGYGPNDPIDKERPANSINRRIEIEIYFNAK